jgi:hypothetical protein
MLIGAGDAGEILVREMPLMVQTPLLAGGLFGRQPRQEGVVA